LIPLGVVTAPRYYSNWVIRSFSSKHTEQLFRREAVKAYPPDLLAKARRKLEILDAAERLTDLMIPPGNRLEKPSGDRAGQYSIRINDQWRIIGHIQLRI
jgi:proteic killer suppression protein